MSSGNFVRRTNASLTAGKLPSPQSRIAPQGPAGVLCCVVVVFFLWWFFVSPHDETKSRFLRLTKTRRWECRVRERRVKLEMKILRYRRIVPQIASDPDTAERIKEL